MLKSQVLLFRMQDLHDLRDSRGRHLQAAQLEGESGPQLLQARAHCRRRRLLPLLGLLLLLENIPVMPACSRALFYTSQWRCSEGLICNGLLAMLEG